MLTYRSVNADIRADVLDRFDAARRAKHPEKSRQRLLTEMMERWSDENETTKGE